MSVCLRHYFHSLRRTLTKPPKSAYSMIFSFSKVMGGTLIKFIDLFLCRKRKYNFSSLCLYIFTETLITQMKLLTQANFSSWYIRELWKIRLAKHEPVSYLPAKCMDLSPKPPAWLMVLQASFEWLLLELQNTLKLNFSIFRCDESTGGWRAFYQLKLTSLT